MIVSRVGAYPHQAVHVLPWILYDTLIHYLTFIISQEYERACAAHRITFKLRYSVRDCSFFGLTVSAIVLEFLAVQVVENSWVLDGACFWDSAEVRAVAINDEIMKSDSSTTPTISPNE